MTVPIDYTTADRAACERLAVELLRQVIAADATPSFEEFSSMLHLAGLTAFPEHHNKPSEAFEHLAAAGLAEVADIAFGMLSWLTGRPLGEVADSFVEALKGGENGQPIG